MTKNMLENTVERDEAILLDVTEAEAEIETASESAPAVALEFNAVGLAESLQRAVAAQGYTLMTPI